MRTEHEDKHTGQVTDNNESDIDVEKSAPPWHKYGNMHDLNLCSLLNPNPKLQANSIKTGGCTLLVLVLLFVFIAIANVFGLAEENDICQCANGQVRVAQVQVRKGRTVTAFVIAQCALHI